MSLNSILGNAQSGMLASQTVLRTIADNVANVNTAGYIRKEAQLTSRTANGMGAGVEVKDIRRAADNYLQASYLNASSKATQADQRSNMLDQVQATFGDPADSNSVFGRLNNIFTQFGAASVDPTRLTNRSSVLGDMQELFSEVSRLGDQIQTLRSTADTQIGSAVTRINELLSNVASLNAEVLRTNVAGGDSSGIEDELSQIVNELSGYMDVRVEHTERSGIIVRSENGVFLAGENSSTLNYTAAGRVSAASIFDQITLTNPAGTDSQDFTGLIQRGEIRANLDLRDDELPALAHALGDLAAQLADELNRVHTDNAALPPMNSAEGRNTGLLSTDSLGFTGQTTVGIVDANGLLTRRVDINFDAGTLSVNGGASAAIGTTIGSFATALNTALGGLGTASFSAGQMTITAATSTSGVAFLNDATNPSDRGGRAFAHFFGLNELVSTLSPVMYDTGLKGTDTHGFTNGSHIDFMFYGPEGNKINDVSYTVSGTTMNDLIAGLNSTTTGIGAYATAALDSNGKLSITLNAAYRDGRFAVSADTTQRGPTGLSFNQMFGVSDTPTTTLTAALYVRADINTDPRLLSLSKLRIDATTAVGTLVVSPGDGAGATEFQDITTRRGVYARSVSEQSSALAGDIGRRSAAAAKTQSGTQSVLEEVTTRRSSSEGVNMDEEMVNMTIFQQAFSANARMIQATKEMFDVLNNMI